MTPVFLAISLMAQLAIAAGATSSSECNLCQAAVNTILSQVKENATEDAIAGKVEALCVNATESSQEDNCREFADKLAPVLVSFLEETVKAEEVCALAGLC
ncbi:saposin domain-containing protein [Aspergillus lucknowensis]|uniref:Saposin B-type domain-containing protein n=1 Tax=Aspergillus lucknowensis TaxID=176173 RepID=A0ABR4LKY7_9EURO